MIAKVRYLLDANVVSEMMRPDRKVAAFLDSVAHQGLALASITLWEILNGIGLLNPGRRRDELERQFRGLVANYFADRLLDWTSEDAAACACIMERKRRRGEPPGDRLPDAMIAGMAANRDLVVVTRNEGEFRNTGAAVVNPWITSA